MTESIDAEYVNRSIYSILSGNSYIELPRRLKNSMKGLINIKNNDNKCFLWCHIRDLNPSKRHPERITIAGIKMVNDRDYECIEFPVSKEDYCKIEQKNNISINVFCYENELTYPVCTSNKNFENCIINNRRKQVSLCLHQIF